MFRIIEIHNSVCEHCDEGKTKAETVQGIVACTTCGPEDPNFVPLISESDFLRNAYKRRGGTEKIHSFEHLEKREYARVLKKEKELLRERCEDTSGFKAENDDINNDPDLSDREKGIALCDSRRKYVKQKIDFDNEMSRWYNEIWEEEEKRVKLAKQVELAKLAKVADPSEHAVSEESEAESEVSPCVSESESEDFGSYESESD